MPSAIGTRIVWSGDLRRNLKLFDTRMDARLAAIAAYTAAEMERYAKTNAKWTDRTGNARNGLRGEPIIRPHHEYGASISHNVPYGIWLEVRWAGRYAIIGPTIQHVAPMVVSLVRRLLSGRGL